MSYDTKGSVVLDMVGLEITGNVMPIEWYNHVKMENGKPDTNAIILLADIVYWYRPVEKRDEVTGKLTGHEKKFKMDKLQRSYGAFADQYGFSKDQVKFALARLVNLGIIDLDWRTVHYDGSLANNVLFIGLNVEALRKITIPCTNQMAQGVESNGTGGRIDSHTNTETTTETTTEKNTTALSGRKSFTPAPKTGNRKPLQEEGDYERVVPGHENDDPWDSTKAIDAIEHLVLSLCYAQNISKTNRHKLHDPVNVLQKGVFVKEPSPAEEMECYPEEFSEWVKKQAVYLKNNGGLSVAKLCNMVTKYETPVYGWLAVRKTETFTGDPTSPEAPWN